MKHWVFCNMHYKLAITNTDNPMVGMDIRLNYGQVMDDLSTLWPVVLYHSPTGRLRSLATLGLVVDDTLLLVDSHAGVVDDFNHDIHDYSRLVWHHPRLN